MDLLDSLNYSLVPNILLDSIKMDYPTTVILYFNKAFSDNTYTLNIKGFTACDGEQIKAQKIVFTSPKIANSGDLMLTEVFKTRPKLALKNLEDTYP